MERIPFHERPLQAAIDIFNSQSFIDAMKHPRFKEIKEIYEDVIPEVKITWPGMGTGLVASIDQVRSSIIGIAYGCPQINIDRSLGFNSSEEWSSWCRHDRRITAESCFAYADTCDLIYGINGLHHLASIDSVNLWGQAISNLEVVSHILANTYNCSSVIQPICMVAELAMKGTLCHLGMPSNELSTKPYGHNHQELAKKLAIMSKHRDDPIIEIIAKRLPKYTDSRYVDIEFSRLRIIKLALGVQFIAASALRRIAPEYDIALQCEQKDIPGYITRKKFANSFLKGEW